MTTLGSKNIFQVAVRMRVIKKILNKIAAVLFPRFCIRCNVERELLCDVCKVFWVPVVPEPTAELTATFAYADPIARGLITAWKYSYDLSAFKILQQKIRPELGPLKQLVEKEGIQAIVPVSLHHRRRLERGFDQSELLAEFLSVELNIPARNLLLRNRATGKQAERKDDERATEMQQTPFQLAGLSVPERLLLVDDVWTTGSTVRAAIRALDPEGRKDVFVYTIAKGR